MKTKIKIVTECGEVMCDDCACRAWNFTHTDWYCNLFCDLLTDSEGEESNALRCKACIDEFGVGDD